jgi:predicted transcriptional regulator
MNIQAGLPESFAPPALRKLTDTGLTVVMMRDIMLKTVFRKNVENATEIAKAVSLPTPLAQELIDMLRDMGLMQATGTLHATSSSEMG